MAIARDGTSTPRQAEILYLAATGLAGKQIGRRLGISVRTVQDHFRRMRRRTGARSDGELIAYGVAAGLIEAALPLVSGHPGFGCFRDDQHRTPGQLRFRRTASPGTRPQTRVSPTKFRDVSGTIIGMTAGTVYPHNRIRVGYARVSIRSQDHKAQFDALTGAHCREVVVETASTRGERPKLRAVLDKLQPGDTLVIYKPDRVARGIKELLVFLEDQLHVRGITLEVLTGVCAGVHRPSGVTIADRLLFAVAALATEMERDLIHERTLDGLRAAAAAGRRGGRPPAITGHQLDIARARQDRGESVTAIAAHLGVGRSTLYRALQPDDATAAVTEQPN